MNEIQKTRRKGLYIDDPTALKVIEKLVKDPETEPKKTLQLNKSQYENKSDEIASSISDSHSLRQMLPDLELAKHIIVSSILSPHDLQHADLSYRVNKQFETHPLSGELLRAIETHFTSVYKIQDELPSILEEALFDKGASIRAVIPESELGRIINSQHSIAQESVTSVLDTQFKPKTSLGVLGGTQSKDVTASLESFFTTNPSTSPLRASTVEGQLDLTVTDNPSVLLVPLLQKRLRHQSMMHRYGTSKLHASFEAARKQKKLKAEDLASPRRLYEADPMVALSDPGMVNVNDNDLATVMKLPMEAVIPVHTPGDPTNHIGYWVIMDENGHPIQKASNRNYYNELKSQLTAKSQTSALIQKTARAWYGVNEFTTQDDPKAAAKVYSHLVEKELLTRLKNGLYQDGVELSLREEVYKLMFARSLAQKGTQLLFLPAEFVSYFAFHYDEEGIGQSLIEATKIVGSIRAMMMFSSTMGMMRNSIGRTMLEIEFDGHEPDPEKLREYVIQEYLNSRSPFFPIGEPNPVNIVDYIRRAGVEVKTSGHPDLPETKVNIDNFNSNITLPESDLEEQMKNRQYLGLGLSPDLMDQASSLDLATSIVRRDLLLSKRVLNYQTQYCSKLSRHIQLCSLHSGELLSTLRDIVTENRKPSGEPETFKEMGDEELVGTFIRAVEVSLPKPDTTTVENQAEAIDQQERIIDQAIDWYLSDEMFTSDDVKELEYLVPNIRSQIKSLYMRRYMRANNILPELDELVNFESEKGGIPLINELKAHGEQITKGLFDYLREMNELEYNRQKKTEADEARRQKAEEEAERKRQEEEEAAGGGVGPEEEEGGDTGADDDTGGELPEEGGGEEPPEEDDFI